MESSRYFKPQLINTKELKTKYNQLVPKILLLSIELTNNYQFISYPNINIEDKYIAWGIRSNDSEKEPIGLLIAKPIKNFNDYRINFGELSLNIVSLKVKKRWRKKFVASTLINKAISWSQINGFKSVVLYSALNQKNTYIIDKLTKHENGWQYFAGDVIVTLSNNTKVGPLLTRLEKVSKRLKKTYQWETYPYPEKLNNELKERILNKKSNPRLGIPYDENDESYQWKPNYNYSRILVANKKIIGWIICYLVSNEMLCYRKIWIDPGWEKSGGFIGMLSEIMRIAHFEGQPVHDVFRKCSPLPSGVFITHPKNQNLMNFTERKFKSICDDWIPMSIRYLNLCN